MSSDPLSVPPTVASTTHTPPTPTLLNYHRIAGLPSGFFMRRRLLSSPTGYFLCLVFCSLPDLQTGRTPQHTNLKHHSFFSTTFDKWSSLWRLARHHSFLRPNELLLLLYFFSKFLFLYCLLFLSFETFINRSTQ